MELNHSFTVPADVATTWATFMDLPLVGGCFPGATVTEVTEEGFAGTVKVKLGPIALVYSGTGSFLERDDTAHRAVIEAKGKDKRGNGTAGATVTIQLSEAGAGSTRADVQTDLAVTGKPAQFGRGVMQDVSDKLLGQFIACIEGKIGDATPVAGPARPEGAEGPVSQAPGGDPAGKAGDGPVSEAAPADVVPPGDAAPTPAPAVAEAPPAPAAPPPAPAAPPPAAAAPPPRSVPAAKQDDALDLGSTVLPVLLKSYGKQVAIGVVVVVAVIVIWRAMSG
ncbi:Carbon monoxide dehydrogenase subunit G [Pedococcus dokdonensis]|uniref:Carbon monoxide dehydrogenase subunit G n=1 Tax=Pedococcus dokdonensis TaxID=443156 RepID=A0A1H0V607_9MICO|nr:SRPBCC family protein [Pedococcus dokdonensis]SDP73705.1 Carbon monoxide dehydrogenase subunit G [Pedococcus dokdonensis]